MTDIERENLINETIQRIYDDYAERRSDEWFTRIQPELAALGIEVTEEWVERRTDVVRPTRNEPGSVPMSVAELEHARAETEGRRKWND